MIQAKIQKWGNSYAVRIPKPLADELGLTVGSQVRLEVQPKVIKLGQLRSGKQVGIQNWRDYLIPMKKGQKRENVSEHIDEILYGKPRR